MSASWDDQRIAAYQEEIPGKWSCFRRSTLDHWECLAIEQATRWHWMRREVAGFVFIRSPHASVSVADMIALGKHLQGTLHRPPQFAEDGVLIAWRKVIWMNETEIAGRIAAMRLR